MDNEHSRLLKFVVPAEMSKMANRSQMRVQYLHQTNIESAVPKKQKLRESVEASERIIQKTNLTDGKEAENPDDYSLSPVLTIKKEEATFVKGDKKLQKVSVTENLAEIKNGVFVTLKPPKHPEIHGEVIQDSQPIRKYPTAGQNKDVHDRKRTKIPKLRFREAVERVKRERREEVNGDQPRPRKSSIPRLVPKTTTTEKQEISTLPPKEAPDDEFEKIYDEIVDSPIDVNINILNTKVEDPVAVENKFEEIIHSYEDENIEQVPSVISNNSKIPKLNNNNVINEPDINVTKNIRKYESITNNENKNSTTRKTKEHVSKLKAPSRIGLLKKSISEYSNSEIKGPSKANEPIRTSIPFMRSQSENNSRQTDTTAEVNKSLKPVKVLVNKQSVHDIVEEKVPLRNEMVEFLHAKEIEKTEVKPAKLHYENEPMEVKTMETSNQNKHRAVPCNVIDSISTAPVEKYESNIETINLDDLQIVLAAPEYKDYKEITDDVVSDDDSSTIIGKVSKMIDKFKNKQISQNDPKKDVIDDDVPIRKSVHSKIALFERQKPIDMTPNIQHKIPKLESPPKSAVSDENISNKPLIVEEVLKPTARVMNNNYNFNNRKEFVVFEENDNISNNVLEIHDIEVSTVEVIDSDDTKNNINMHESRYSEDKGSPFINQEIKDVAVFYDPSFSLDSKNEHKHTENNGAVEVPVDNDFSYSIFSKDSNDKRFEDTSKNNHNSSREIEPAERRESVKEKARAMFIRINSTERLDTGKSEVINAREKPREKSVFEKIALFESKFTNVSRQTAAKVRVIEPVPEPKVKQTDIELGSIIEELKNAKEIYGITETKYITLSNGIDMPVLALGTAWLKPPLLEHVISAAIELGYRAIDTAFIHNNEKEVGNAIRKKIEDGTVRREDLFIISKLWSTFHRTDLVEKACRASLETMGLTYFDQYLVHNPMSFKEGPNTYPRIASVLQYSQHDYMDAWFGMERLVAAGLARSIGLCNFNSDQLHRILDKAKVKPVVNQVESHPYLTQHKLQAFCNDRNITLVSFGVLGSKSDPKDYNTTPAVEDPLIQVMAAGLQISPAQLLISYQLQHDRAVVVKASSAARLHENLSSVCLRLQDSQLAAVGALNRNKRLFTFKGTGDTHRNYPFKTAF
ncbi:hypothetical protein ACJJTC_002639 [Scirpophaga incertulas]